MLSQLLHVIEATKLFTRLDFLKTDSLLTLIATMLLVTVLLKLCYSIMLFNYATYYSTIQLFLTVSMRY